MMGQIVKALAVLLAFGLGQWGFAPAAQAETEPDFAIWDVQLGLPVVLVPDSAAAVISCGTKGGPASIELASFADWAQCPAETTGLHEVQFSYDDEKDYIARALESEYRALAGGTSIYAHPVVLAILVDNAGLAQGVRIITDDRVSNNDRRVAVVLSRNMKVRFGSWGLVCENIPMKDGEMKVGNEFIHEICRGTAADGSGQQVLIEASYLRKKGQDAISKETQMVNKSYYESKTWVEITNTPYSPSEAP